MPAQWVVRADDVCGGPPMADPLPVPWQSTAPQAPAPAASDAGSWMPDLPSINPYDMAAVMAQLDPMSVPFVAKAFGVSMPLSQVMNLLVRLPIKDALKPEEMVQAVQMGSYFARHVLGWPLAATNLDHWLIAGGLQDPALIMDHTPFVNQEPILGTLCDKHYEVIKNGIINRLKAKKDDKFPPSTQTIPGPMGKSIVVNPAESPLGAGGEETLYYDASTLTTDSHTSDMFNAVNAVHLVSQVHVTSQVLDKGAGWQVTLSDWQVWFYDTYDWNLDGQSVSIPIHLFDQIPGIAQFRPAVEAQLKNRGLDPSLLDNITITDAQMRAIEGKTIAMPGNGTMQPKAYPIYSDASWPFDPKATCDKDKVLTIPPT